MVIIVISGVRTEWENQIRDGKIRSWIIQVLNSIGCMHSVVQPGVRSALPHRIMVAHLDYCGAVSPTSHRFIPDTKSISILRGQGYFRQHCDLVVIHQETPVLLNYFTALQHVPHCAVFVDKNKFNTPNYLNL